MAIRDCHAPPHFAHVATLPFLRLDLPTLSPPFFCLHKAAVDEGLRNVDRTMLGRLTHDLLYGPIAGPLLGPAVYALEGRVPAWQVRSWGAGAENPQDGHRDRPGLIGICGSIRARCAFVGPTQTASAPANPRLLTFREGFSTTVVSTTGRAFRAWPCPGPAACGRAGPGPVSRAGP
jgi:hypothetical protein